MRLLQYGPRSKSGLVRSLGLRLPNVYHDNTILVVTQLHFAGLVCSADAIIPIRRTHVIANNFVVVSLVDDDRFDDVSVYGDLFELCE